MSGDEAVGMGGSTSWCDRALTARGPAGHRLAAALPTWEWVPSVDVTTDASGRHCAALCGAGRRRPARRRPRGDRRHGRRSRSVPGGRSPVIPAGGPDVTGRPRVVPAMYPVGTRCPHCWGQTVDSRVDRSSVVGRQATRRACVRVRAPWPRSAPAGDPERCRRRSAAIVVRRTAPTAEDHGGRRRRPASGHRSRRRHVDGSDDWRRAGIPGRGVASPRAPAMATTSGDGDDERRRRPRAETATTSGDGDDERRREAPVASRPGLGRAMVPAKRHQPVPSIEPVHTH